MRISDWSSDVCSSDLLADVPLLIIRGDDGRVRAFFNACSHRSTQIEVKPSGNRAEFECPYHRWLFNKEGELVGCPNQREFIPGFEIGRASCRERVCQYV